MRLSILLISLFFAGKIYALSADMSATVAEEMYIAGEYKKAISKCEQAFKLSPQHKKCKQIVAKCTKKLFEIKEKKTNILIAKQQKEEMQLKKSEQAKQEAKKQEEERIQLINSAPFALKKLCYCKVAESFLRSELKQEEEVGKIGGFVNKQKIYSISRYLIIQKKAEDYWKQKSSANPVNNQCPQIVEDINAYGECINDVPQTLLY